MKTREQIVQDLGGVASEELVLEDFRQLTSEMKTRYQRFAVSIRGVASKDLPSIDFELVNDSMFRCCVQQTAPGDYLIAVSLGAIYLVVDTMNRLAGVESFFAEVAGEASLPPHQLDQLVLDVTELRTRGATGSIARTPQEPSRARLARKMVIYAIDFLVHHELGHILHGHVGFRREQGQSALGEVSELV